MESIDDLRNEICTILDYFKRQQAFFRYIGDEYVDEHERVRNYVQKLIELRKTSANDSISILEVIASVSLNFNQRRSYDYPDPKGSLRYSQRLFLFRYIDLL